MRYLNQRALLGFQSQLGTIDSSPRCGYGEGTLVTGKFTSVPEKALSICTEISARRFPKTLEASRLAQRRSRRRATARGAQLRLRARDRRERRPQRVTTAVAAKLDKPPDKPSARSLRARSTGRFIVAGVTLLLLVHLTTSGQKQEVLTALITSAATLLIREILQALCQFGHGEEA